MSRHGHLDETARPGIPVGNLTKCPVDRTYLACSSEGFRPGSSGIHASVLALVSAGYIRGRRPVPRRAAASSTAFSFAPESPRGTSPLPSPQGSGGNGLSGV